MAWWPWRWEAWSKIRKTGNSHDAVVIAVIAGDIAVDKCSVLTVGKEAVKMLWEILS